jgi:hypothetical protein
MLDGRMVMRVLGPAMAMLLAVGTVQAAGEHELLAAEQELKIARDHLAAAGPEYQGHRRAAMEAIDRALREIREGLKVSRGGGGQGPAGRTKPRPPAPEEMDD